MKTDEQTLREALEAGLTAALTLEVITAKSEPETSANCHVAAEKIVKAIQATNTPLEYETPEEYTKRTGEEVSDDAIIWAREDVIFEDGPSLWRFAKYGEYRHMNECRSVAGIRGYIVVLAEKGKGAPPEGREFNNAKP